MNAYDRLEELAADAYTMLLATDLDTVPYDENRARALREPFKKAFQIMYTYTGSAYFELMEGDEVMATYVLYVLMVRIYNIDGKNKEYAYQQALKYMSNYRREVVEFYSNYKKGLL